MSGKKYWCFVGWPFFFLMLPGLIVGFIFGMTIFAFRLAFNVPKELNDWLNKISKELEQK